MSSWKEKVIQKILPSHSHHLIVIDTDGLLEYVEIRSEVSRLGYKIICASDSLSARIRFELEIRSSSDKCLLVVPFSYDPLPDIQIASHVFSVGYKDIFPYFDPKALSGLSYNALCSLSDLHPYTVLGYDGTLRFLLENLYHIDVQALSTFKTKERVLAALIEVMFHPDGTNLSVTQYLKTLSRAFFPDSAAITSSREQLKAFLQNHWAEKIKNGESDINFSDPLLSKTLGSLFTSRVLEPVTVSRSQYSDVPQQLRMGTYVDENEEKRNRLTGLVEHIESRVSSIQDQYMEWFELASALGESYSLAHSLHDQGLSAKFDGVLEKLNVRFQRFITNTYWSLFSLSGSRYPVVISRVLDYIKAQPEQRKALIVIDGMNLWQWHAISEELQRLGFEIRGLSTFAYLPTITAWSRQALFRGGKPDLTEDNSKEQELFFSYWLSKGYQRYQVSFSRFGTGDSLPEISSSTDLAAFLCNDLDDLMHGAVMGNDQLFQDSRQWVEKSGIVPLLRSLKEKGFTCYITTDHGNIEATAGRYPSLSTRNLSKSRSKRHIQFVHKDEARQFIAHHPELSLGTHEASVYLRDQSAFINNGKTITHGGSHIFELIIPIGVIQ